MQFRISDTFTESLARLSGEEQRAAKTTAFDLQLNPAQPGPQFRRVNRARDKNFWSVRVSQSVRMIVCTRRRPISCSAMSATTTMRIAGRSVGASNSIRTPMRRNSSRSVRWWATRNRASRTRRNQHHQTSRNHDQNHASVRQMQG